MPGNDSIRKTLTVALLLCLVCSVLVSAAVVLLKPVQQANKSLDRKRNILATAAMLDPARDVEAQFAKFTPRVVDLRTGRFTDEVDPARYDQRKAAKDPATSDALDSVDDIAKIGRREHYSLVYIVENDAGDIDRIVLPIRGYGLWSTLYGYVALKADANTVIGLGFTDHGETPGLGGEVDNPRWKALWPGKQVYRDGEVALSLIKGNVDPSAPQATWQVDGLAGSTLTSRGVTNLVHFWLGENGFGPFLAKLKAGEA